MHAHSRSLEKSAIIAPHLHSLIKERTKRQWSPSAIENLTEENTRNRNLSKERRRREIDGGK